MSIIIKKITCIFLMICTIISFNACSSKETQEPDVEQVRNICKLATLECYYNNVAEITQSPGKGIKHILEKERIMWIEYVGIVSLGVDFTKVKVALDAENVTITIPEAKVLYIKEKEGSRKPVYSEDGVNSNKITSDTQTKAIKEAQDLMEKKANSDSLLLQKAQQRAKDMIKNYVDKIGSSSGITYNITWESVSA